MEGSKAVPLICIFTFLQSSRHYGYSPLNKSMVNLCPSFLPVHQNHKIKHQLFCTVGATGHRVKNKAHEHSVRPTDLKIESLKTTPISGQKHLPKTT